jgi:hypothetical protein
LMYSFVFTAFCGSAAYLLYWKKIFIKI